LRQEVSVTSFRLLARGLSLLAAFSAVLASVSAAGAGGSTGALGRLGDPKSGPPRTDPRGGFELIPAAGPVRPLGKIPVSPRAAVDPEVEPNDTVATAQALPATPVKVHGDLFRTPASAGTDVDYYAVTGAAGDRLYAATMTGFSAGSPDTVLDVIDTDGTTVLETDDEDGAIAADASNVAGVVLPAAGTYYVRVRQYSEGSLTATVRPYDLYVRVLTGSPTAETEPNGPGMPEPLPANGWASGTIDPAGDSDVFAVSANAGDTIVAVLDADPERDAPDWDARLGIGDFNGSFLVVDGSSVGGPFDDSEPSEASFMTVKSAGTYYVYVDEAAGGGAAGDTYDLSVSVIPGGDDTACATYQGSTGAIADLDTTDFTLNVPTPQLIGSLKLALNISHPAAEELAVSLISPDGNEVVLVDGAAAAGAAPQVDTTLDDDAAVPISFFGVASGTRYQPDADARLAYFDGMESQGTWTLRIRDQAAGGTGTLNAWSLTVCAAPAVCTGATSLYSNDFEAGDGGFTHSGTADEWERGLPSSEPITTAHSGVNAWKTDLDGTYEDGSDQDLVSPAIVLPVVGDLILSWWQKYQIESASFDSAWVEVREVGNPANSMRVWEWKGATMTHVVGPAPDTTVEMSAGWARMLANISSFAGKTVEVVFHLDSDATIQLAGLAIDDVAVVRCGATAVTLESLSAKWTRAGVVLTWRTSAEPGIVGYDVYAGRRRLNRRLIPSRGGVAGGEYRFTAAGQHAAGRFWLEGVRADGTREWFGPVSPRR
jgi:subtilisin-like proprotein convertase family protein